MRIIILSIILILSLFIGPPLWAQDTDKGNIMMAGSLLFRIRCASGGMSIAQRAESVQRRVNDLIIPGGIDMSTVQVKTVGSTASIYAAGSLLVTVTSCDARANKTTVGKLANQWAERFKMLYPGIIPPEHGQSPPTD
jgi:hypothetical protein